MQNPCLHNEKEMEEVEASNLKPASIFDPERGESERGKKSFLICYNFSRWTLVEEKLAKPNLTKRGEQTWERWYTGSKTGGRLV